MNRSKITSLTTTLAVALLTLLTMPISQITSSADGPAAHLKFDEGTGIIAADSSGNGNSGTLYNGPAWTSQSAPTCFGNPFALNFDGGDDIVLVPSSPSINFTGEFSGAVWLKTLDPFAVIAEKDTPGVGNPAFLVTIQHLVGPAGHAGFVIGLAGQPDYSVATTVPVNDGNWHHLAWVRRTNSLEIYLDGQLNNVNPSVPSGSIANNENLAIGSEEGGTVFGLQGTLDDFRLYNKALSPSEVQAVFCDCTTVQIDIKPGSFPNSINLGSNGVVPVAIFSSDDFDATQVNPLTVSLASAPVKLKGNGTPQSSVQDINGDGRLDLVVHVSTSALQLSVGDAEASLEGSTYDGKCIKGKDSIRIVP